MAKHDDENTDTVIAVSALGGGALLAWWLLRGRRFGGGAGSAGVQGAPPVAVPLDASAAPAAPPCQVFLRGEQIELDGATADVAATVATCRAAGTAYLRATGLTTTGAVMRMARALNAAGVAILAHDDIADSVRDALTRAA